MRAGFDRLYEAIPELDSDVISSILEEAGKFTTEVIAPTNRIGDEEKAHLGHTALWCRKHSKTPINNLSIMAGQHSQLQKNMVDRSYLSLWQMQYLKCLIPI